MTLSAPSMAAKERVTEGAKASDILSVDEIITVGDTSLMVGDVEEIGGVKTRRVFPVPPGILEDARRIVKNYLDAPVERQGMVRRRIISSIRRGRNNAASIAAAVALAIIGAGALGAAGCSSPNDSFTNPPAASASAKPGERKTETRSFAMTAEDNSNFGDRISPNFIIDENSYGPPSLSVIDGQNVLIFTVQAPGEDYPHFEYVSCGEDLMECMNSNTSQPIIGMAPQVQDLSFGVGVYSEQIRYTVGDNIPIRIADIGFNGDGELQLSNEEEEAGITGTIYSIIYKEEGGEMVPYLYWNSPPADTAQTNLNTGEHEISEISSACGLPTRDSENNLWYHSRLVNVGGDYECRLVWGNTEQDLIDNTTQYLASLNEGAEFNAHPQVHGKFIIFNRIDANGQKIYYAMVQPYCGDGTCDEDETGDTCQADCPVIPPDGDVVDADVIDGDTGGDPDAGIDGDVVEEDAGGDPDVGDPDATPDGDIDQDAGVDGDVVDQDTGGDPDIGGDQDATPDGDLDAEADTEPEVDAEEEVLQPDPEQNCTDEIDNDEDGNTDCDDSDCVDKPECEPQIDPCEFAETNVNIIDGECEFQNCDPEKEIVDVIGKCSFEVYLGGENPTILTIDGGYGLDLLDKVGDFLYGKYEVDDNGNVWDTKFGNFGTGVGGTIYGGELINNGTQYHVYCDEGYIEIYWTDEDGEIHLLDKLVAGEESVYDVEGDPTVVEQPDGDVAEGDSDVNDGDQDASTPDSLGGDTVESNNGGGGGGCSASPEKSSRAKEFLALLALAILALRRRTRKEA